MATTLSRRTMRSIAAILVAAFMIIALGIISFAPLLARDYGQYESVSPIIRGWIESLTDHHGIPCCSTADGIIPDAWEIQKDHYRVKINGEWAVVPDAAVVKSPNKLGHAIVWIVQGEMYWGIICFLPGPEV
jgi:hypothetical protein